MEGALEIMKFSDQLKSKRGKGPRNKKDALCMEMHPGAAESEKVHFVN